MRGDAVSEACKTRSAADDRTADTVVRNRDVQRAVVLNRSNRHPRWRTVLDGVRERLAGHEVGGCLDARRRALAARLRRRRGSARSGEVAQGGGEPLVEPRRPNACCDLAEVGDGRPHLGDDLVEGG